MACTMLVGKLLFVLLCAATISANIPMALISAARLSSKHLRDSLPDSLSEWKQKPDAICVEGLRQSPIDLALGEADLTTFDALQFYNYYNRGALIVENVERTGVVEGFLSWDEPPYITGGNLTGKYFLRQLHFHWHSEHTLNGLHYPLEVHLVHKMPESERKNDNTTATVVVVAVFFQPGDDKLDGIDSLVEAISRSAPQPHFSTFIPRVLLPNDLRTYFHYSGSLTTNPCTENVSWIIFAEPKAISFSQLAALKSQNTGDGLITSNARPVQPLNGRKLYFNKSVAAVNEEELFQKVLVIVFLCAAFMLVPPFLIMWVIQRKAALPDPNQSNLTFHSTQRSPSGHRQRY